MRAVIAIFVDAYRELSSRKIFWITLILSALLVITYASIGFTESGVSILYGLRTIEASHFTADSPLSGVLYKGIFSYFIVGLWLAWAATILALISTASMFPDLVARGSIDLMLSKPVSRMTIFFTKYVAGLLFAILQVSIVCVGVFFATGWRVDEWNWAIFLAIPIVTVFFSYLYCISALVGTLTRSSITALLLALLFWFSLFSVQQAEGLLHMYKMEAIVNMEQTEERKENAEQRLAELDPEDDHFEAARRERDMVTRMIEDARSTREGLERWHGRLELMMHPLPKTGQTIGLLNRWLVSENEVSIQDLFTGNFRMDEDGKPVATREPETEAQQRMMDAYDENSLWYVIGTSLLFELLVLLLACWIFVRRDY